MKFKIACATNDEKFFTGEHFGEADSYIVFIISDGKIFYECTIKNTPFKEEKSRDPKKLII